MTHGPQARESPRPPLGTGVLPVCLVVGPSLPEYETLPHGRRVHRDGPRICLPQCSVKDSGSRLRGEELGLVT